MSTTTKQAHAVTKRRAAWKPTTATRVRNVVEGMAEIHEALAAVSVELATYHHAAEATPETRTANVERLIEAWGDFLDCAGRTIGSEIAKANGGTNERSWAILLSRWARHQGYSGDGRGALGHAIDEELEEHARRAAEVRS